MEMILDLQFSLRSRDILLCKELAVIPLIDANVPPVSVLFKPSCRWHKLYKEEQALNLYLENRYHKIPWNSGYAEPTDIVKILQANLKYATEIYLMGTRKKEFISNLLPEK